MRSNVDLPHPVGPSTQRNSPYPTSRVTSASASRLSLPVSKILRISSRRM